MERVIYTSSTENTYVLLKSKVRKSLTLSMGNSSKFRVENYNFV